MSCVRSAMLLAVVSLSGCSSWTPRPATPLLPVPFWPQSEYQCGPAALASVLNASGVAISPAELVPLVYLPERRGSVQAEMQAAPRNFGRVAYLLEPDLGVLVEAIKQGLPSLVFLNLGLEAFPVWHYAVVIGVDSEYVWLHSGQRAQEPVQRKRFAKQWRRADQWAMVLSSPEQIPAVIPLETVRQSLVALEEPFPDLALAAYGAAGARWPADAGLAFGRANVLLALGETAAAVRAFEELLDTNPASPPIINNLAHAVAAEGQAARAVALLDEALGTLTLDAPWRAVLEQSREELAQAP